MIYYLSNADIKINKEKNEKLLSLSEMEKDEHVSELYRVLITIVWVFSILLPYRFREDVTYRQKTKNRKLRRTFGNVGGKNIYLNLRILFYFFMSNDIVTNYFITF